MLKKFRRLFGLVTVFVVSVILGVGAVNATIGYDGDFENFTSLKIADVNTTYNKGDKVGVIFEGNKDSFKSVSLTMVSKESGDNFEVTLNDDFNSFIIPDTVKENETYEMNDIMLYLNVSGQIVEQYSAKENGSHTYMNPEGYNKITIRGQENLYASVQFRNKVVDIQDKIYLNYNKSTDVKKISLVMKNLTNGKTYTVNVKNSVDGAYISLSKKTAGEYVLKAINLTGQYSSDQVIMDDDFMRVIVEDNNITAQSIVNNEETKTVKVLELLNNYETIGNRVYVNLVTNINVKSAKITLSDGSKNFTLSLKNIKNNPYFVIPSGVTTNRYVAKKISLVDINDKKYSISLGENWLTDTYTKINV